MNLAPFAGPLPRAPFTRFHANLELHVDNMREVRIAAGAEFVVMVCGDIMTMPGLPKVPSACKNDLERSRRRESGRTVLIAVVLAGRFP